MADSADTSGNQVVTVTVHNPSVAEQQRVAALLNDPTALAYGFFFFPVSSAGGLVLGGWCT